MMGLDITAYRRITKLDAIFDVDGDPIDPKTSEPVDYDFSAYLNHYFPGRADEIDDGSVYAAKDVFSFHAGGYGGYNGWRNSLAELAGYPSVPVDRYNTGNVQMRHDQGAWDADGGPFWELINFSDCEGVIGSAVSAKLADDFAEFQEKADTHHNEYFRAKYAEWRKAFEMAKDGGAVRFQ